MIDLNNLGSSIQELNFEAPETMRAFWEFDKLAAQDGAIPARYKELMAVAVALTTQCGGCIAIHAQRARDLGATKQEFAEVAALTAALRAGGAIVHATLALK